MSEKKLEGLELMNSLLKSWCEPKPIINKHISDYRTHKEILSRLANEKKRSLDSFNESVLKRDELNEVKTLISKVRDYVISKDKDLLENFINTALSDIFQRNYRLSVDESKKGWDFYFYENDNLIAVSSDLLSNVGGGVSAVLGVLFRFYIGLASKNELFFMLDESFGQVSSENRARLSKYLRSFCEGAKATVVLVSHSKELDEYSHNVYELDCFKDERGVNTLRIDEVLTNPSESDLPRYLVNIANFQSIKEIEFGFSGFNVIRGQNNIGKSAVIRSIGSVIYGDITGIKDFIRNEPKKRGNPTNFTLSFKKLNEYRICFDTNNGSSKYEFFDENENSLGEFIGSKNSSEPVRKLLEKCGFKDTLSNLKTNATSKELEGIAKSSVTSQFDEPYLIADKASVINSVISMLFGAENIATALNKANADYNTARLEALQREKDLNVSTEKLELESKRTQEIEANARNEYEQTLMDLDLNKSKIKNDISSLDKQIDSSKKWIEHIYSQKNSTLIAKANSVEKTIGELSLKINEATNRISAFKRDICTLYELSKAEVLGKLTLNDNSLVKRTSELISALRTKKGLVGKKINQIDAICSKLMASLIEQQKRQATCVTLKMNSIQKEIDAKELELAYFQKQQAILIKAKSDSEIKRKLSEHNAKIKTMYYGFGLAGVVIIALVLALIFVK